LILRLRRSRHASSLTILANSDDGWDGGAPSPSGGWAKPEEGDGEPTFFVILHRRPRSLSRLKKTDVYYGGKGGKSGGSDGGGSYGGKGGKSGGGYDDDEPYGWTAPSPPKTDDGWSAPKEGDDVYYGGKGGKSGSKGGKESAADDDASSWHAGSINTAQSDLKYSGSSAQVQAQSASPGVRRIVVSLGAVAGAAVLLL